MYNKLNKKYRNIVEILDNQCKKNIVKQMRNYSILDMKCSTVLLYCTTRTKNPYS